MLAPISNVSAPELLHLRLIENGAVSVASGPDGEQLGISGILLHALLFHGIDGPLQGVQILLTLGAALRRGLARNNGARGHILRARR